MSSLAFDALGPHAERLRQTSLRALFAQDSERSFLCHEFEGLYWDASRQRVDAEAWEASLGLAQEVEHQRDRLFAGDCVNVTEQRPALHPALRDPRPEGLVVDGSDVLSEVHAQRQRMQSFVKEATESWRTVINLGIGGSDLGPRMLCQALPAAPGAPEVRFASTLDPAELQTALRGCDADQTLFIIASKTFTTEETQRNFTAAQAWLKAQGVTSIMEHFVATTAAAERAEEAGIASSRIFPFWVWVGGRYSVWSSVGLPVALHAGWEAFAQLLEGAHAMDRHFCEAPASANLPIMQALLMLWNHALLGAPTRAVLPYDYGLRTLPRFLQQLQMESLGKQVGLDGNPKEVAAPVVWGGSANDGAHAFFQLLHQGTQNVPVDALIALEDRQDPRRRALLAQCLAQLDLLAAGRQAEEVEPAAGVAAGHYVHPGNRPSTLFLLKDLSPRCLGSLLALFEHATFSAAVLWGINAFDQFGVEYGKRLSQALTNALQDSQAPVPGHTLQHVIKRLRTS